MKRQIPAHTRARQKQASDPRASSWVSANAGSGKTHVLAQRVVRILLSGVAPARLLCLTFTKAAAANMAARVFKTLGDWTLMDDAVLRESITSMGAEPPKDLDEARKLFARAVETPGGLKIQTIHAFCERLLHLFPFEADVPADFRVIEDLEQAELAQAARRQALIEAQTTPAARAALALLSEQTWEDGFGEILGEALEGLRVFDDADALARNSARALGLGPQDGEAEIVRAMIEDGVHWREWGALAEIFDKGSKTDLLRAKNLREGGARAPDPAALDFYLPLFFTEKGDVRASLLTKAVGKIAPDLEPRLRAEADRLRALIDKRKSAAAFARTKALLDVAARARAHYQALKQARGLLDFNDLIDKTHGLLRRSGAAAWALYKLDGGIDHILVDEAQDTSQVQWDILSALSEEFFAGESAMARKRAFFAVGDEKQSIFSFQGAAPQEFSHMRRFFAARAQGAQKPFHHVRLELSFRSAPEILQAVDLTFAAEPARAGLSADGEPAPQHMALRQDAPGLVEIWPPIKADKPPAPEDWALPLDLPRADDPASRLAQRIAARIKEMIAPESQEAVLDEDLGRLRPIASGDVMILVRRRNHFFEQMARALKEAGVPVAGVDRLNVGGHIAAMDLIAAMRAARAPYDDYTLACVLKSPLIGLDDDDLIALAPRRQASLWEALRASTIAAHQAAADRIDVWRARADARPFDFLSDILGPEGGRRAFLERLGPEAADAIDELMRLALDHERQRAPSLASFADMIESLDLTVRRDMEAAGGRVRLMTVHAAKGLEAKIVFLPDTCATPARGRDKSLFWIGPPEAPALVWSPRRDLDPAPVTAAREKAHQDAMAEYRRLLYVAMTRAEERLYICGYLGQRPPDAGCWHDLIVEGLGPHCEDVPSPFDADETILRFGRLAKTDAQLSRPPAAERLDTPDWLWRPASAEIDPRPPLRPSAPQATINAPRAQRRGLLVHALLQSLGDVAPDRRPDVARNFLRGFADLSVAAREDIAREALAIIANPELAPFFGPQSRAEIAFSADLPELGISVLGRLDRLAELGQAGGGAESEIWIADFKTGAPVIRDAHIRQMALYRAALTRIYQGASIRAFLIFTRTARAMEIDARAMDEILAKSRSDPI